MAKEIVSLTMDQLEKVSGGAPEVFDWKEVDPCYEPKYRCNNCGYSWYAEGKTYTSCPNCPSTDIKLFNPKRYPLE